ncbi:hypothetical protein [Nesterenkonia sp. NBAIMH1]|uniref:hypothetical protein n=1 Tax=Nesterenkonia sp. NBAIMH1 TaxID=2600320 RepID=UPI0011B6DF76|nr:hypothetical protein [Nesterenkonia sp. NBAIMH1]
MGTVTIDDFAEVDSVQTDGQTAVAAEGEQLRYVEWSYEPADDPWSEDGELSVRIGGEEQSGALAGEEISGSFIASVAEGDALVLLGARRGAGEISLAEGRGHGS